MSDLPRDPVVDGFYQDLANKVNANNYQSMLLVVFNALTAAKKGNYPTKDEMIEYAVLCQQTGLNPLIRSEIAPLCKGGRVSLIVQRDGWIKIARSHKNFNGLDFVFSEETVTANGKTVPAYIDCLVYEKGIDHPMRWRTTYAESVMDTEPWRKEPTNMLQIRALARGIRNAFGVNCYTPEEVTVIDADIEEEKQPVSVVKKQQITQSPALPRSNTQAFLGRIKNERLQFDDKYSLNGNLEETKEPIQSQQESQRQRRTTVTAKNCELIKTGIDKAEKEGTLNQHYQAYCQQIENADVTPQEKEELKKYLQDASVRQGQAAGYGVMTGGEEKLNG